MKAEEFLTNKGVLNVEWDTDECGEFTLTELLDEYADEVSRERVNSAWLRGFNEGRLAHPIKEQEEQQ